MKTQRKRDRIRQVAAVFIRHGIKKGIRGSIDPVNVRLAFEELGPTFVKIGQMLSTRQDMIPREYTRELQKLQDNVRPEKYAVIRAELESSLGRPLEEIFSSFDSTAAACASVAEVHRARLLDGSDVMVKIQRPQVKETILADIGILRLLARFVGAVPAFRFINLKGVLDELEKNTELELDFLNEAKNAQKFADYNAGVKFISCPKVYDRFTSANVLVMEYINGLKIDDISALDAAGYDRTDIGRKLAANYIKQVFEDGFFHADPHPGNLMVSGGKIAYLDFGLMGCLDKRMLQKLNRILNGIASGDIDAITNGVLRLGVKNGPLETHRLYDDIEEFYDKYVAASFDELNISELVNELITICVGNNIVIPREVTMLGKGLLIIESVLAKVSPDISIVNIAADYAQRHLFEKRDAKDELMTAAKNLYAAYTVGSKIPSKLLRILGTAQAGEFTVKVNDTRQDKNIEKLGKTADRVVIGLIISALLIASSILLNSYALYQKKAFYMLGMAGFACAGVLACLLAVLMLKSKIK